MQWLSTSNVGLYFRFSHRFAFGLPTVLGPGPRQANIIATGGILLDACQDLARLVNAPSFSYRRYPGFHTSIAVLALGTLLQTAMNASTGSADRPGRVSPELLASACRNLSRVHPTLASVISRLRKPMEVTQAVSEFAAAGRKPRQVDPDVNTKDQDLYEALGMPPIPEGMDSFTDWIWPADEDWLSGLLSMDPSAAA
jgi:hypothetical protein